MPKFLLRIVAFLLVLCLIVDPTLANPLLPQSFAKHWPANENTCVINFREQALISRLAAAFTNPDRLSVAVPIRLGAAAFILLGFQHAHVPAFFHFGHETLPWLSMAFPRRDLFRFSRDAIPLEAPPPDWVLRRLGIITGGQWDRETSQRLRDRIERSSPETIARTLRGAIPSLTLDEWNVAWDYIGLFYAPGDHLVTHVGSLAEIQGQSPGKIVARCLLEALQQQPLSVQTERTSSLIRENPLQLTRRMIIELLAVAAPLSQRLPRLQEAGLHPEIGLHQIPLQLGPEARRLLEAAILKFPGIEPLRRMPLHLWSDFIARVYPPVYTGRWKATPISLPAEAADLDMHIRLIRKLPSLQEARAMARATTRASMDLIDAVTHVNAKLQSESAGRPSFQLYTEADAANTINELSLVPTDTWLASFENRELGSIFFGSSEIRNLIQGMSKPPAHDTPHASEPSERVSAPLATSESENIVVPNSSPADPSTLQLSADTTVKPRAGDSAVPSAKHRRVIIVGAGMAGSYAAALAATEGFDVEVWEKSPIDKTQHPLFGRRCGEGVWLEKMRQAGFDFDLTKLPEWVDYVTHKLLLGWMSIEGALGIVEMGTSPYLHMNRQIFELAHLRRAESLGAKIVYGHGVNDLEEMSRQAQNVPIILATGINAHHRMQLLTPEKRKAFVPPDHYVLAAQHTYRGLDLVRLGDYKTVFFFDDPRLEYLYIFPKGNSPDAEVNVGIGLKDLKGNDIFRLLDQYVEIVSRPLGNVFAHAEKVSQRTFAKSIAAGSPLAYNDIDSRLFGQMLPVGDVADQTSALSGGGIGYALFAAKAAVNSVIDHSGSRSGAMQKAYFYAISDLARKLEEDYRAKPLLYPESIKEKAAFLVYVKRAAEHLATYPGAAFSLSRIVSEAISISRQPSRPEGKPDDPGGHMTAEKNFQKGHRIWDPRFQKWGFSKAPDWWVRWIIVPWGYELVSLLWQLEKVFIPVHELTPEGENALRRMAYGTRIGSVLLGMLAAARFLPWQHLELSSGLAVAILIPIVSYVIGVPFLHMLWNMYVDLVHLLQRKVQWLDGWRYNPLYADAGDPGNSNSPTAHAEDHASDITEAQAHSFLKNENSGLVEFMGVAGQGKSIPPIKFRHLPSGQKSIRDSGGAIVIDLNQIHSLDELRYCWRNQIRSWMVSEIDEPFHVEYLVGSALAQTLPWGNIRSVLNNADLMMTKLDHSNLGETLPDELTLNEIRRDMLPPDSHSGERVLELGSGWGNLTLALRALGFKQIVGIELSAKMLDLATLAITVFTRGDTTPITLMQGDILHLPFREGSFDKVFSRAVISAAMPWNRAAVLAEVFGVLPPGGWLVMYEYYRLFRPVDREPASAWYWTRDDWRLQLEQAGFVIRQMFDPGDPRDPDHSLMMHVQKPGSVNLKTFPEESIPLRAA